MYVGYLSYSAASYVLHYAAVYTGWVDSRHGLQYEPLKLYKVTAYTLYYYYSIIQDVYIRWQEHTVELMKVQFVQRYQLKLYIILYVYNVYNYYIQLQPIKAPRGTYIYIIPACIIYIALYTCLLLFMYIGVITTVMLISGWCACRL